MAALYGGAAVAAAHARNACDARDSQGEPDFALILIQICVAQTWSLYSVASAIEDASFSLGCLPSLGFLPNCRPFGYQKKRRKNMSMHWNQALILI